MTRLIKFTRPDGVPVWVNLEKITTITEDDKDEDVLEDGPTVIEFEASHQTVREPAQEVVDAINSANS